MATLDRAIQIASKAHEGQRDKQGKPYILHPLRVMAAVRGEAAQIVAVLHDVIEDTTTTVEELIEAGFSDGILAAILCVTHKTNQSYAAYVIACKKNELARQVKIADLSDNTRLDRTLFRPERIDRDLARIRRYFLSYRFLMDEIDEDQFLSLMEPALPKA
jgi:hypothetical protein